ncbi:oligosaccharide flippase family protein [Halarcobacter sp.]|uniref:oligosaccharide flippase family protein n=1 Tax=Halarcobacter sp. TaxID=2321133 RepID=UPI003A95D1A4
MNKTFWYLSPTIISGILGILSIPLLTAYLSVEEFGLIELFMLMLTLFAYLFGFGWDSSFVRFYNDKECDKKNIVFTTLIFRLFVHIMILLMCLVASDTILKIINIEQVYAQILWVLVFVYILEDYINLTLLIFRSNNMAKHFGLLKVNQNVIRFLILVISLVLLNIGLYSVFYSLFISTFLMFFYVLYVLKDYAKVYKLIYVVDNLKNMIFFGSPLVFAAVSFFIINYSDRYMLNFLLEKEIGLREVGLYSFYSKIAAAVLMFSIVFKMVWAPMIYKYYSYIQYKRVFRYLIEFFVLLILVLSIISSFFSNEILNIFTFNDDYLFKYNSLSLIFAIQLLILIGDYAPIGIGIKKKNKYRAYIGLLSASLNICLNFILIPLYELNGALMASFISMLCYVIILNILANKLYFIKYNNGLFFIGISMILSGFFISTLVMIYKIFLIIGYFIYLGFILYKNRSKYILVYKILKKESIL